jgi:uncharacterized protein YdeI (YjbR/CyaY-like superfamily)
MKMILTYTPSGRADWRAWLEANHNKEQEVWVVYFKPGSGKSGISYEESVEEALCFGWIDSIIQKIDEEHYARKFNPRRMESAWSETNRRRIVKLIRGGRMAPAGMAKVTFNVEAVNIDMPMPKRQPAEMPEHVEKALRADPQVWEAFQKISPSLRRTYILWLTDAKKPETFQKRLHMLANEVLAGKPTAMH